MRSAPALLFLCPLLSSPGVAVPRASADAHRNTVAVGRFRVAYTQRGISFGHDRKSLAAGGASFRLTGYGETGYGETGYLAPVASARIIRSSGRVEYRRGVVTEWYANTPDGLEQGFTLHAPPPSGAKSRAITLGMAVSEGVQPVLTEGGRAILLHQPDTGDTFRYSGLKAWDAHNRPLPSSMDVRGHDLRLNVDTRNASYPITVDPILNYRNSLRCPDPNPGPKYGQSVGVSGGAVAVGAPSDNFNDSTGMGTGRVFIYNTPTSGNTPDVMLERPFLDPSAIGWGISYSGNTMATGTDGQDAVFVFQGVTPLTWTQQTKIIEPNTGLSVSGGSLDGDTLAVIGSNYNTGEKDVYVYQRTGTVWGSATLLKPNDPVTSHAYLTGFTTAVSGNTIIACGISDNHPYIYVWVRSGGVWNQQAKIDAVDPAHPNALPNSVALDGDTALVCTDYAPYIYTRTGTAWSRTAMLQSTDSDFVSFEGYNVALSHGTAVVPGTMVGPPADPSMPGSGLPLQVAYVFRPVAGQWTEVGRAGGSGSMGSVSVATDGTTLAVGNTTLGPGGIESVDIYTMPPNSGSDLEIRQEFYSSTIGRDNTITLYVTNNGPDQALNVGVSDTLPTGFTLTNKTATNSGVITQTGNNVTVAFPSLAVGATATITLTGTVDCSVAPNTTLTNSATVTCATDLYADNNTSIAGSLAFAGSPLITSVTATPNTLAPPDHRMVDVTVNYTATDSCDASVQTALTVQSSEPTTGTGAGDLSPDWVVVDAHHVQLRAEASPTGKGRTYTITITATGSKGTQSTAKVAVTVAPPTTGTAKGDWGPWGDVNGDGSVTQADVDLVKAYLNGTPMSDAQKERIRRYGDVNNAATSQTIGNGTVNIQDLSRLAYVNAGTVDAAHPGYGDVNGDGIVDLADTLLMQRATQGFVTDPVIIQRIQTPGIGDISPTAPESITFGDGAITMDDVNVLQARADKTETNKPPYVDYWPMQKGDSYTFTDLTGLSGDMTHSIQFVTGDVEEDRGYSVTKVQGTDGSIIGVYKGDDGSLYCLYLKYPYAFGNNLIEFESPIKVLNYAATNGGPTTWSGGSSTDTASLGLRPVRFKGTLLRRADTYTPAAGKYPNGTPPSTWAQAISIRLDIAILAGPVSKVEMQQALFFDFMPFIGPVRRGQAAIQGSAAPTKDRPYLELTSVKVRGITYDQTHP